MVVMDATHVPEEPTKIKQPLCLENQVHVHPVPAVQPQDLRAVRNYFSVLSATKQRRALEVAQLILTFTPSGFVCLIGMVTVLVPSVEYIATVDMGNVRMDFMVMVVVSAMFIFFGEILLVSAITPLFSSY